jgi:hypothetical protein
MKQMSLNLQREQARHLRLRLHAVIKVRDSNANNRPVFTGMFVLWFVLGRRNVVRFFSPHTVDAPTEGSNSGVVTEEDATGLEGFLGPSVIREGTSVVR